MTTIIDFLSMYLAAALFHSNKIDCENVIIVATGGNIDKETFTKALTNYN